MKVIIKKICVLTTASLLAMSIVCHAENPGIQALNEGKLKDAENYFKTNLNEPSLRNESLIGLSRVHFEKGNTETAISFIEQALSVQPTAAEELKLAGDLYCNQAQKSSMFSALKLAKKCIAQYEAAVSAEPNNIEAVAAATRFHLEAPSVVGGSKKRGEELLSKLKTLSLEFANTYQISSLNAAGKEDAALQLADEMLKKEFKSEQNQYEVAHFLRDKKQYSKANQLFLDLMARPVNAKNRWYVNDSILQAGEILLIEKRDLNKSVELLEQYKQKNSNPNDIHYFWSTWSLAKAHNALGNKDKYNELVQKIKSEDYKKNPDFAKEFEAAI